MSERSDKIKALAESLSEKLWAQVIALPPPGTALVTLIVLFFVALGVRSLL